MSTTFEFTQHMADISNQLWGVTSGVGAVLCFLVLLVVAVMYTERSSRAQLDRVSYRVVLYALAANMFLGIASAVGGFATGPSTTCSLSIFVLQFALQFSGFLLFCIALNIQLIVVHGVTSQKLERCYIIGSIAFALCLTVPPFAAGQYGWDPLERDCWYTNDNRQQRIAWQIGSQLVWTGVTSIGELLCAACVIVYMLGVRYRQRNIFGSSSSHVFTGSNSGKEPPSRVIHAQAYKWLIVRVALYPAASCIVNLTSIATVIHSTLANGIKSQNDYNILLLSDFLYGGRAIVYAILAATDPAFSKSIRAFVAHHFGWRRSGQNTSIGTASRKSIRAVRIDFSAIEMVDFSVSDIERNAIQATDSAKRPGYAVEDMAKEEAMRSRSDPTPDTSKVDAEYGVRAELRSELSLGRISGLGVRAEMEESAREEFARRI